MEKTQQVLPRQGDASFAAYPMDPGHVTQITSMDKSSIQFKFLPIDKREIRNRPTMQNVGIDLAFTTLLMFLFGVVAWVRPNDRAKCWLAGWLCALIACIAQLMQFSVARSTGLFAAFSAIAMVAAGIFFLVTASLRFRWNGALT